MMVNWLMRLGYIEVMDHIAQVPGIREDAGARADRELKREAALRVLAARVHAHLHDALPDGLAVAVTGEVANSVKHQASNADSIGYSM